MTTGAPTSDDVVGSPNRPVSPEHLDRTLARLARVSFRAKFHLRASEHAYVTARGLDTIRRHARELIDTRLAPAQPHKDGRQTPWVGHPVFRAQHATATCYRSCLSANHAIAKGLQLSAAERDYVVDIISRWIERECASAPKTPTGVHPTLF